MADNATLWRQIADTLSFWKPKDRATTTIVRQFLGDTTATFAIETFIDDVYLAKLRWYDQQSKRCLTVYSWFRWVLILASSLTTIIVSAKLTSGIWHIVGPLVSLAVTLVSVALSTFRWQELWVDAHTARTQLETAGYLYRAKVEPYADADAAKNDALFIKTVVGILRTADDRWAGAHQNDSRSTGNGQQ